MAKPLAYDRSSGCDSVGIDHPGCIVLSLHSGGFVGIARPTGRPPVARGFGRSWNIDAHDQEHNRKSSARAGPAVDRSVRLLIPKRTFGFDLRTLPDDRNHRRALCATLGCKILNFSGRIGGACHGWRLASVPWRSL